MPAHLLAEWMAYAHLEPFGPIADFTRTGIVASQLYNVNRTKSSQPLATPQDYLPTGMLETAPVDDETLGERNANVLRMIREPRHGQ
jgi:hypothetical protein